MKVLTRRQFGNPVLRTVAIKLSSEEVTSKEIQQLIVDMRHTLQKRKYGVGLAAPQVGKSLALSVIGIKPTPTRPDLPKQNIVIINPEMVATYGKRVGMWEGCISGTELYAKAMRYPKIRLKWLDEQAMPHEKDFDGFMAQVIQHEVDHLNGILFVDRVEDTKTYVTFSAYKKMKQKGTK